MQKNTYLAFLYLCACMALHTDCEYHFWALQVSEGSVVLYDISL